MMPGMTSDRQQFARIGTLLAVPHRRAAAPGPRRLRHGRLARHPTRARHASSPGCRRRAAGSPSSPIASAPPSRRSATSSPTSRSTATSSGAPDPRRRPGPDRAADRDRAWLVNQTARRLVEEVQADWARVASVPTRWTRSWRLLGELVDALRVHVLDADRGRACHRSRRERSLREQESSARTPEMSGSRSKTPIRLPTERRRSPCRRLYRAAGGSRRGRQERGLRAEDAFTR